MQIRLGLLISGAAVALGAFGSIRAGAPPTTYRIDFFAISAGGNTLRGNCYRLSGTVGQPAPGYSSGSIESLIAGYWQPAPTAATDEIFFNGFQGC
jgi:hypothetical protein